MFFLYNIVNALFSFHVLENSSRFSCWEKQNCRKWSKDKEKKSTPALKKFCNSGDLIKKAEFHSNDCDVRILRGCRVQGWQRWRSYEQQELQASRCVQILSLDYYVLNAKPIKGGLPLRRFLLRNFECDHKIDKMNTCQYILTTLHWSSILSRFYRDPQVQHPGSQGLGWRHPYVIGPQGYGQDDQGRKKQCHNHQRRGHHSKAGTKVFHKRSQKLQIKSTIKHPTTHEDSFIFCLNFS